MSINIPKTLTSAIFGLFALTCSAEQSTTFGDYTIHYNAFPTTILDASIAKSYNISRSKNRALLNIAILKKVMGTTGSPVTAKVVVTAANLSDQLREIPMREITEKGAIYYIGEMSVANQETLKFKVEVTPEGQSESYTVNFMQQFFTD
jgi:hypothetical protein